MKMVILVGPQGSGNHLFSKIFSIHEEVAGWKESLTEDGYFIPHWFEPFNDYWNDMNLVSKEIMGDKKYAVTSVSAPYLREYYPKIPDVPGMVNRLKKFGIEPIVVVIGRDRNILDLQQTRVRGGPTWGTMQMVLNRIEEPPFFVSQELLYLYRKQYLRSLEKQLDFPIAWKDPIVEEILSEDANRKYIRQADATWLDAHVKNFLSPNWMQD